MNPLKMFKLFRDYEKFQSIAKENASMNAKIAQITALLVTVIGTFGVSDYAQGWVGHHAALFGGLAAAAQILHALFPSIFAKPVTQSAPNPPTAPNGKAFPVILLAGLLLFGVTAKAQTPTEPIHPSNGFSASSDALAVDVNGQWSAGTLVSQSFDFLDFGKTKAHHVYLVGNQFLAPTPGFQLYTGGVRYEPDFSSILTKTNLPVGNFGVFVDGSVGSGISSGPAHIAWLAGGGVRYALTSQLSWQTLQIQYGGIGAQRVLGVSTGLSFIFHR